MVRVSNQPEYRFVVPGPAVSFRSPKRDEYRTHVQRLASSVFPKTPTSEHVEIFLDYFHTRARKVDIDNVAKNVLDALNRIAYEDDRQVVRLHPRAHSLAEPISLPDGPVDLIKPLADYAEYLFIRIRKVSSL